jgi:hypothetical protein
MDPPADGQGLCGTKRPTQRAQFVGPNDFGLHAPADVALTLRSARADLKVGATISLRLCRAVLNSSASDASISGFLVKGIGIRFRFIPTRRCPRDLAGAGTGAWASIYKINTHVKHKVSPHATAYCSATLPPWRAAGTLAFGCADRPRWPMKNLQTRSALPSFCLLPTDFHSLRHWRPSRSMKSSASCGPQLPAA